MNFIIDNIMMLSPLLMLLKCRKLSIQLCKSHPTCRRRYWSSYGQCDNSLCDRQFWLVVWLFSKTRQWLELWTTTHYCGNSHITWHWRLCEFFYCSALFIMRKRRFISNKRCCIEDQTHRRLQQSLLKVGIGNGLSCKECKCILLYATF